MMILNADTAVHGWNARGDLWMCDEWITMNTITLALHKVKKMSKNIVNIVKQMVNIFLNILLKMIEKL